MHPGEVLIGAALALFAGGIGVSLIITAVAKLKKVEQEIAHGAPKRIAPELESRLARIEQIVEVTAVEVERVAEAQRYVARQLAEQSAARLPSSRPGGRADTPH